MLWRTEEFPGESYPARMESSLPTPSFRHSTWESAIVPRFVLVTSLLIAGCSSSPGTGQPAPADTGSPAATIQGTPTVAGTVAPPEAGPSAPAASAPAASAPAAAIPGKTSPPPAQKATQVAAGEPAPNVSEPPIEPAPPAVTPQPTARASTPAPQPAATARAPIAVDIGGLVEVGPTKPGLTRIGSDKCKLCHKVQFTSWAATAHAARTPPLDCESCHGAGSEYKTLAIMKDAKKARAAGLVTPVRAFCAKCHTTGWSDDLLKRAHAHKAGV